MTLRFHPTALVELQKSADYYAVRSPQAAQQFALAVEGALQEIRSAPNRYIRVGKRERACRVKKYPFQVIYRISNDVLYVVALAHAKRRPGYWRRRK